jgi:Na+-transporting methylmalonyl-CoA/oxaloacetate decarboxylase beta subunit
MFRIAVAIVVILSLVAVILREVILPRYLQRKYDLKTNKKEARAIGIIGGADRSTIIIWADKVCSRPFLFTLKIVSISGVIYLLLTRI